MKVVINPKFSQLTDIINGLPEMKFTGDSIIREKRNFIYKIEAGGETFVIKKFKKPTVINRFVYTFFRKSKAERAYEFAFRLKELAIDTPEPVAYIEIGKHGIFHTGFFVSRFSPHPSLEDARDIAYDNVTNMPSEQYTDIMKDFLSFTLSLHEKGVMHYDYNISNVLYFKTEEGYRFSLIDINQMKFGKMSPRQRRRCIRALGFPLPVLTWFTEQYALRLGEDALNYNISVLMQRKWKVIRRSVKKNLRERISGPLKRLFKRKR